MFILALSFSFAAAQKKTKFNYAAQKNFIPAELGKVYLGMPFDEFAKQIDLKNAAVGDTRFEWLELTIPVEKGNVSKLTVKIHGLTQDDKKAILRRETLKKKDTDGFEYEEEIDRLITDKIPSKGFVYAMYVDFKQRFRFEKLRDQNLRKRRRSSQNRRSISTLSIFNGQKKLPTV